MATKSAVHKIGGRCGGKVVMLCNESAAVMITYLVLVSSIMGLAGAASRGGLQSEDSAPPSKVQKCREGCLDKFATDDFSCLQGPDCSMSGFPTYNFHSLPEAMHLLCWDQCVSPPTKINTSIQETWPLRIITMIRQGSLVSADVAWPEAKEATQCLVTWEVAGGGLMGNLLTDSASVELSLWPETKYRVQVTCKNKVTEAMTRSLPLTLDTSSAVLMVRGTTQPAIPKSHDEEDDKVAVAIDDEVIHQNHDHPHLHPHEPSDDSIPATELDGHGGGQQAEDEVEKHAKKPYTNEGHHTKINSILRNELLDQLHQQRQSGHLRPATPPQQGHQGAMGDELLSLYSSRKEITMGICAAFSVFLIIVMVFVMKLHRTRPVDKETLIDNEADVGFLPPPSSFSDSATSQATVHV